MPFQDSVKQLLLVGGGHSHLAVLRSFGDAPAERVRLALLSPGRHAFYSGMVPGAVAGHYRPEDCRIDLEALAARAGARFLDDSATGIDPARREVITASGKRFAYDFLSLDIGSSAGEPAGEAEHALRVRPVEAFLAGWERLRESARRGEVRRIAVIGCGTDLPESRRNSRSSASCPSSPATARAAVWRASSMSAASRCTPAERSLPQAKTGSSSTAASASRRRPRYGQAERTHLHGSRRAGSPPTHAASSR